MNVSDLEPENVTQYESFENILRYIRIFTYQSCDFDDTVQYKRLIHYNSFIFFDGMKRRRKKTPFKLPAIIN